MEHADVVELADTTDLNSVALWACEFKSHHRHHGKQKKSSLRRFFPNAKLLGETRGQP